MSPKDFEVNVEYVLDRIKETLTSKGREYAGGEDRLKNFYDSAEFLECEPERALLGFVTKHMIALKDFIINNEDVPPEQLDEKMFDIICYMVLLRGLLIDRGIYDE